MSKDALASTMETFPEIESGGSQRMIAWMFVLSLASGIVLGCAYVVSRAQDAPTALAATPAAKAQAVVTPAAPAAARDDGGEFRLLSAAELKGRWFIQVGIIDHQNVPAFVESLAKRGFMAMGAEGISPANLRILIPPPNGGTLAETTQRLQQAGFACYPISF